LCSVSSGFAVLILTSDNGMILLSMGIWGAYNFFGDRLLPNQPPNVLDFDELYNSLGQAPIKNPLFPAGFGLPETIKWWR